MPSRPGIPSGKPLPARPLPRFLPGRRPALSLIPSAKAFSPPSHRHHRPGIPPNVIASPDIRTPPPLAWGLQRPFSSPPAAAEPPWPHTGRACRASPLPRALAQG
ncbi:hypothetical protein E2562_031744 [Oryza meyeriana var. granulata]|uniref:Uncharacterized protein n=1 Tax=Oryza meyeriana var. granulata TaxID=110450 RepID=A0A6G1CTT2_9ORYZ|nr:hypothetical protein E2562_031744 [Oryza meyeriana var. granulata]